MKVMSTILMIACLWLLSITIIFGLFIDSHDKQIKELQSHVDLLQTIMPIDSLQFHFLANKNAIAEGGFYLLHRSCGKPEWVKKIYLERVVHAFQHQDSILNAMLNRLMQDSD